MNNKIIKYHNDLNAVIFKDFTSTEMNLFFSIVSQMRNVEDCAIEFTWDDLRELSKYKPENAKRFLKDLNSTYSKMLNLNYGTTYIKSNRITLSRFVLFTRFDINYEVAENGDYLSETGTVSIKVNPDLLYILNDLNFWTNYSLDDFLNLKSSYSKTLFRILKQFRTQGFYSVGIEDFREILDVPDSYAVGQIDQKVIKPALKELEKHFKNLSVKKKHSKKRGTPVTGYTFTWIAEEVGEFKDFSKMSTTKYKGKSYEKTPEWVGKEAINNESSELEKAEVDKLKKKLENFWK